MYEQTGLEAVNLTYLKTCSGHDSKIIYLFEFLGPGMGWEINIVWKCFELVIFGKHTFGSFMIDSPDECNIWIPWLGLTGMKTQQECQET